MVRPAAEAFWCGPDEEEGAFALDSARAGTLRRGMASMTGLDWVPPPPPPADWAPPAVEPLPFMRTSPLNHERLVELLADNQNEAFREYVGDVVTNGARLGAYAFDDSSLEIRPNMP